MNPLRQIVALAFGMLIGLLLTLIVLIVKLVRWPFTHKGVNMSAETVAGYLRNELSGGIDDHFRWEDLEAIKIRDPYLEGIRKQAVAVGWPRNTADLQKLEDLLQQLSMAGRTGE